MEAQAASLASSSSSRRHRREKLAICKLLHFKSTASPLSLSPPNQTFSSFVLRSAMEDEIELKTAPADFRFPTTNQTRHCFTRYIEFHRCTTAKGEDSNECERFAKYYRALCPGEWVDKWNEQRETGTFPGPL
ncbi:cytochrome c oxidase subunit 6b-3 [Arabidopsis lyrata subsp. lyrata]|uniref:cytochrome c oxidase subunit 6b-3 n=1 Tax=Arabidopsis lyrata subsp. lyrata TaxID=81972 RepID=UPI000A29CA2D|nr:cytochrome c oxidase subunit 6b-3 [Arabidopsis lyrata subsp. lyrata]|eukprot:XP_002867470.2 cytochrome c oxidase subunit 6b-3 [Arabidopsis lyrata subsp. lyrata]